MPVIFDDTNNRLQSIENYIEKWIPMFKQREDHQIVALLETFRDSIERLDTTLQLKLPEGYAERQRSYVSSRGKIERGDVTEFVSPYPVLMLIQAIEDDWMAISQLCIQRLHNASSASDTEGNGDGYITELLKTADNIAFNYYHAFDGVRALADPLVVFDKSFHVTRYKLTPYPIIGVPFRFYQQDMESHTIAHEVGHYIYSHSDNPADYISIHNMLQNRLPDIMDQWQTSKINDREKVRGQMLGLFGVEGFSSGIEDGHKASDEDKEAIINYLAEWMEEIIADIFGVLLSGPGYIDSSISLILKGCRNDGEGLLDNQKLRVNNRTHPSPYLRPLIACQTLRWIIKYVTENENIASVALKTDPEYINRLRSFLDYRALSFELLLILNLRELHDQRQADSRDKTIDDQPQPEDAKYDMTAQTAPVDIGGAPLNTNTEDDTYLPDNHLVLTISAMEFLVTTLLEGYETESGTVNTWQKRSDDDRQTPFGIGALIRDESYIEFVKTLSGSDEKEAYPPELNLSDVLAGAYTANPNRYQSPDARRVVKTSAWDEAIQAFIKKAEDMKAKKEKEGEVLELIECVLSLIYAERDFNNKLLTAFLNNVEYYLNSYNANIHAKKTAYRRVLDDKKYVLKAPDDRSTRYVTAGKIK